MHYVPVISSLWTFLWQCQSICVLIRERRNQHICLCSLNKVIIYFGDMSGNTRIKAFKGHSLTLKSFKQILRLKLYLFETFSVFDIFIYCGTSEAWAWLWQQNHPKCVYCIQNRFKGNHWLQFILYLEYISGLSCLWSHLPHCDLYA